MIIPKDGYTEVTPDGEIIIKKVASPQLDSEKNDIDISYDISNSTPHSGSVEVDPVIGYKSRTVILSDVKNWELRQCIEAYKVLYKEDPVVEIIGGRFIFKHQYGVKDKEFEIDSPVLVMSVKNKYLVSQDPNNGRLKSYTPISGCTYRIS